MSRRFDLPKAFSQRNKKETPTTFPLPSDHRTSSTEFSGRVVDYFYDELYRLTSEQATDNVLGNRNTTFSYDKVGNRQSRNATCRVVGEVWVLSRF